MIPARFRREIDCLTVSFLGPVFHLRNPRPSRSPGLPQASFLHANLRNLYFIGGLTYGSVFGELVMLGVQAAAGGHIGQSLQLTLFGFINVATARIVPNMCDAHISQMDEAKFLPAVQLFYNSYSLV